ncbi:MAG: ATP-binding protein, partial [Acidobacteria bacterium]|nr:ATP-binding protein [Acidobacteriota bacterium]
MLKKTVGNWVDDDRLFDLDFVIVALSELVSVGRDTLLVAQRRMGKTSLVRELLRRLNDTPGVKTAFIDLEDARDPADAIVQISLASRHLQSIPRRAGGLKDSVLRRFRNVQLAAQHEEMRFQLRADINSGNWKLKGDRLLRDLTRGDRKVVLAIDELSILVNRILKQRNYGVPPENIEAADEFLSWLRRHAQEHRGQLCLIVSGSVGIAPILKQAGLSAAMNVFSAYELKPWSESTASDCLGELAENYGVQLPVAVREAVCRRLRFCIPHHVQQFFDALHRQLRIAGRKEATLNDADIAYREDMLAVRGQIDMDHYEQRLKMVLGTDGYRVALELLAQAASEGFLHPASIDKYKSKLEISQDGGAAAVPYVLEVLVQDGYFTRKGDE